ncbi:hypothetical protein DIPPA_09117 [Diplonema papillatum]|nr:hypothetical protein DIPPA_09117 [Diplonema papillatum]
MRPSLLLPAAGLVLLAQMVAADDESTVTTPTATHTETPTLPTPTDTGTATLSLTATDTLSLTVSLTPSSTLPTPTDTATTTLSLTATDTLSLTETDTLTTTDTLSLTETDTLTTTDTLSLTETSTLTPTDTLSLTETESLTLTASLTATDTLSLTQTISLTPTITESLTATLSTTATLSQTMTMHERPIVTAITTNLTQCWALERAMSCLQLTGEITFVGTGFPDLASDITDIVFTHLTGDAGSVHPTCVAIRSSYYEMTCTLSADAALGNYSVIVEAYVDPVRETEDAVVLMFTGDDAWSEPERTLPLYASAGMTFTFPMVLVEDGDPVYLVTSEAVNCTDPGTTVASSTSAIVGSGVGAKVTFPANTAPRGTYYMCFATQGKEYHFLDTYPVYLRDVIDPLLSRVCCADGGNTMLVGDPTTCTITALDTAGEKTGSVDDECRFGISPLKDGAGGDICAAGIKPAFVELGVFTFSFVAEASGCNARVGVLFNAAPLSNIVMLTFLPGVPVADHATSTCEMDNTGSLACNVTKRDSLHNPTEVCYTRYGSEPTVDCKTV